MSHSQRYALWMYEDAKTIKEDKLYLVRNKQTEELAVKRYIRKELIRARENRNFQYTNIMIVLVAQQKHPPIRYNANGRMLFYWFVC